MRVGRQHGKVDRRGALIAGVVKVCSLAHQDIGVARPDALRERLQIAGVFNDRGVLLQFPGYFPAEAVQLRAIFLMVVCQHLIVKILLGAALSPRDQISDHHEGEHEEQDREHQYDGKSNDQSLPKSHKILLCREYVRFIIARSD